ncbi:MAG: hypothetical protein ACRDEB_02910, partial [Chitinophagaceae bacterium]
MDYKIIAGILGLIGGFISAIIVPWGRWQFDKKRERYKHRKKFIDDTREQIIRCKNDIRFFCTTPLYSQLRPFLTKKLIKEAESNSPTSDLYIQLLDYLHKL